MGWLVRTVARLVAGAVAVGCPCSRRRTAAGCNTDCPFRRPRIRAHAEVMSHDRSHRCPFRPRRPRRRPAALPVVPRSAAALGTRAGAHGAWPRRRPHGVPGPLEMPSMPGHSRFALCPVGRQAQLHRGRHRRSADGRLPTTARPTPLGNALNALAAAASAAADRFGLSATDPWPLINTISQGRLLAPPSSP